MILCITLKAKGLISLAKDYQLTGGKLKTFFKYLILIPASLFKIIKRVGISYF